MQKTFMILPVFKNVLAAISTRHHVVTSTWYLNRRCLVMTGIYRNLKNTSVEKYKIQGVTRMA